MRPTASEIVQKGSHMDGYKRPLWPCLSNQLSNMGLIGIAQCMLLRGLDQISVSTCCFIWNLLFLWGQFEIFGTRHNLQGNSHMPLVVCVFSVGENMWTTEQSICFLIREKWNACSPCRNSGPKSYSCPLAFPNTQLARLPNWILFIVKLWVHFLPLFLCIWRDSRREREAKKTAKGKGKLIF